MNQVYLDKGAQIMLGRKKKWAKQTERIDTNSSVPGSSVPSSNLVKGKTGLKTIHSDIEENYEAPPSRWIQENFVPNGFADDDGAMKQVESPVWRNMYQSSRKTEKEENILQDNPYPT